MFFFCKDDFFIRVFLFILTNIMFLTKIFSYILKNILLLLRQINKKNIKIVFPCFV